MITNTIELLSKEFVLQALFAAVLAGFLCGFIGPLMLWRKLGQLGNAVSHAALTPIALASWLRIPFNAILFPFSIGLSILLARLEERGNQESDASLSVFFVGMMALGVLILTFSGRGSTEAVHILFGDILFASQEDILILAAATVLTVFYVGMNRRELLLMVLNPDLAAVEGVPVRRHSYLLMIVCGVTVAAALKLMGAILMTSLILVPPLVAANVTKSLKSHLMASVLIGLALSGFGFIAAVALDLPSGATIATLGLATFLVTGLIPR